MSLHAPRGSLAAAALLVAVIGFSGCLAGPAPVPALPTMDPLKDLPAFVRPDASGPAFEQSYRLATSADMAVPDERFSQVHNWSLLRFSVKIVPDNQCFFLWGDRGAASVDFTNYRETIRVPIPTPAVGSPVCVTDLTPLNQPAPKESNPLRGDWTVRVNAHGAFAALEVSVMGA